jgi:hypothetical protein
MRLLIAAGGTGGHIYPALAVATSIRRRPDAPELDWVGGRRGLESQLVPPAGFRCAGSVLRSLRSVEATRTSSSIPIRLALSVPQALWWLVRRRPAASSRPAATSPSRSSSRRACSGSRPALGGQRHPGRSVRATARLALRARGLVRGDLPALPTRGRAS